MADGLLLLRLQVLNLREDPHSLCAVVDGLQIVIIQIRIVQEAGGKNTFN